MPEVGEEMICGIGASRALRGFVINRKASSAIPSTRAASGPPASSTARHREDQRVLARVQRRRHPLIWLQDISGFDIGHEAEGPRPARLRQLAHLHELDEHDADVHRAAAQGLGRGLLRDERPALRPGRPAVDQLRALSVMEGRTLAIAAFNTKLDDNFQITATDPAERAKIEAGMKETEARIERDMDPFVAARQLDTDEIIELGELRAYLAALVEMSYQNTGYRRVKNPRIWSLHDLRVLVGGPR
jgi:hypothetical protein